MASKNKPLDKLTGAAIILIIIAVLYFAYSFAMGIKLPSTSYNYSLGQFRVVNAGTIKAVKGLSACGNWPLTAVSLSTGRGNPFSVKTTALPQMTATSTVLCLPVTQ